jgi:catechol 2,3-dioxygenase-like lactoylglutathione lyase family enzyme
MEPRVNIITLGVEDLERSFNFYKDGLGLITGTEFCKPTDGIIFFKTKFTALALYPYEKLAQDIGEEFNVRKSKFSGITLAHNTNTEEEVDAVLKQAADAGGVIVKPAKRAEWGGYSGYFTDPDGHLWEVACSNVSLI